MKQLRGNKQNGNCVWETLKFY